MHWITTLLRRPPISLWDIADILVVSVLIYVVLKLIKGTRAVQMATGALLLVAVFYVSRLSRLDTFNWLVRNVLGYIVFAIIVLFQSDIRRALAHLGRAPFFRYLTNEESAEDVVEELVIAANLLATHRIGAIIAIERLIGLRSYIEGGHRPRRGAHLRPDREHLSARPRPCTTARSSCRTIEWRRPRASCR